MSDFLTNLLPDIKLYGGKLLLALLVFVIGWLFIKYLMKFLKNVLAHSRIDATLHSFIHSTARIFLFVCLLISCAEILGIPSASLITALGAVGLAFSLAVKDSLGSIASGIQILMTKPFGVGDYVEISGVAGLVSEVNLVHTVLYSYDNKKIIVPNNEITGSKIINYSAAGRRRLDQVFSIGYGDSVEKAREIILALIEKSGLALPEPAPVVEVTAHAASALELTARVWAEFENYWALRSYLLEEVKAAFDREGISIPYPQMDVHMDAPRSEAP